MHVPLGQKLVLEFERWGEWRLTGGVIEEFARQYYLRKGADDGPWKRSEGEDILNLPRGDEV